MTSLTFHTVAEAATLLGISRQAVWQQIESKSIRAEWMLNRWAIPASEVRRIKKERKANGNTSGRTAA